MGLRLFKTFGMAGAMTALAIVLGSDPAAAQQTAPATTNQATPLPAPTPTPTPTPGSIGNPALQNFNLDGTVTREATPAPASAQPPVARPAPARDAPAATDSRSDRSPAATATRDDTRSEPTRNAAPPSAPEVAPVASAPNVTAQPAAPDDAAPDLMPPAPVEPAGGSLWPWLLALALAAGGAAWWWRRQQGEANTLAFAGHAPDVASPVPTPARQPAPAPAPRTPAHDGGIVSRALQPKLAFELRPLKFETDDKQSARLTFELLVANIGSAPARDVRIEAKMFNAGPEQDREIVSFFRSPGAMGAKLPPIGPQDRVPLRSRIGMTAADYQALAMGGRSLVVPMIAVNAVYRGSAGETQESASWLVGALPSGGEAEKLRPFPLDKPVATTALAARVHSAGIAA